MNLPPVILASASPRRVELLRQVVFRFKVLPSDAPESEHEHFTPREIALLNAYHKARTVAKRFPDSLVIGADTVVAMGTTLYAKPRSKRDACRMLAELEGRTHQVLTGVCLLHLRGHRQSVFADLTAVRFNSLTEAKIRSYVERVHTLDKAGAYAIQEEGEFIIDSIDGSYTNVVGLPVERLREELYHWAVAAEFGATGKA
jgi:septum formation protein